MVIYNREKEELIIPTGLGNLDNEIPFNEGYQSGYTEGNAAGRQEGYDNGYENGHNDGYNQGYEEGEDNGYANGHQDGVESGYTQGFGEGQQVGFENGEANQKSKMAILTAIENGHYEREDGYNEVNVNVQPNLQNNYELTLDGTETAGQIAIVPDSGYDGIGQGTVYYSQAYEKQWNDGYASGNSVAMTLTMTLNFDEQEGCDLATPFNHGLISARFNGVDVRADIDATTSIWWDYLNVFVPKSIVPSITEIELVYKSPYSEDTACGVNPFSEITVDDIKYNILNYDLEYLGKDSASPHRDIWKLTYATAPIPVTDWYKGYSSGYTDGAASVSGGCRLDTNYEIFLTGNEPMDTSNTIHFGPNTEWFDGISSGAVYYQNAYQVKFNQGYQSGYTAGRSDFEVHLQDKEVIANVWSPTWTGEITITPDEGYDGMGEVRVSAATQAEIIQYMQNDEYAMLESIEDFISDSAETITITSNGTYTASGSATFNWDSTGVRKVLPTNFKSVTVNVPSNLVVDGTINMTSDYTFSQSEMHDAFIYGIPADSALEDITIDGMPVIGYPQNELTLLTGTHTFHANYGNLVIKVQGGLAQVGIPNGTVTYGRITRE